MSDHPLDKPDTDSLLPDISETEKDLVPIPVNIPYTYQMAEHIIAGIFDGKKLTDMAGKHGVPNLSTIFGWMRKNPDFREAYDVALKAQALLAAEEILELNRISADLSKEEVPAYKLKFDILKFIAERNDRDRYAASKPKEDTDSGTTIVINTGIKKEEDTRTVNDLIIEMKQEGEGG